MKSMRMHKAKPSSGHRREQYARRADFASPRSGFAQAEPMRALLRFYSISTRRASVVDFLIVAEADPSVWEVHVGQYKMATVI